MSVVTVKPPVFAENAPATWFIILEAQFNNLGITVSKTKFYHALSSLPVSTVQRISENVITSEDYDQLKKSVVENYEATKPELFENLLSKAVYTGRPSVYLSEIRQLASKVGVSDDLIRHKFVQSMPQSIRAVLASQQALGLDALGKLADELVPLCSSTGVFAAETTPKVFNRRDSKSDTQNSQPKQRQNMGLVPFHPSQKQKICRAHIFYGNKARSCRNWCVWPDKRGAQVYPTSQFTSRDNSPSRHVTRYNSPERTTQRESSQGLN